MWRNTKPPTLPPPHIPLRSPPDGVHVPIYSHVLVSTRGETRPIYALAADGFSIHSRREFAFSTFNIIIIIIIITMNTFSQYGALPASILPHPLSLLHYSNPTRDAYTFPILYFTALDIIYRLILKSIKYHMLNNQI